MTDKNPKKTAETPVNIPATLAGTTDTARDSTPKSRALPQVDALKARFKAGSIPLQTDFADVIDLANMGGQAVGGTEGQTGPANGFTLSSEGLLELKPNAAKGIVVDKDGIAVKMEAGKGLMVTASGVSVQAGNGVAVSSGGVHLRLLNWADTTTAGSSGGLTLGSAGLSVQAGNGVAVSSSGVHLRLLNWADTTIGGSSGGLTLGSAGLSVQAGNGISVDSTGVAVRAGNGVVVNSNGVSLKLAANSGLSADEKNGLKVVAEQQFQRGMIMMFSGSSIPLGWALCNGNNGTPNLINRFIMGGVIADVNGKSTNTFSGSMNTKSISFTTKQSSVKISGSTDGHSLTAEENGPHSHYAGIAVEHTSKCLSDYKKLTTSVDWLNAGGSGTAPNKYEPRVRADGTGKKHSHSINLTSGAHDHANELTVPYYILAFIMKL